SRGCWPPRPGAPALGPRFPGRPRRPPAAGGCPGTLPRRSPRLLRPSPAGRLTRRLPSSLLAPSSLGAPQSRQRAPLRLAHCVLRVRRVPHQRGHDLVVLAGPAHPPPFLESAGPQAPRGQLVDVAAAVV